MPPNRKAAHDLITDVLPNVSTSLLAAKTVPVAEPRLTVSYWDWPVDDAIARIQYGESIRELLSSSHIEANVVEEAKRLAEKKVETMVREHVTGEDEDYWQMSSEAIENNGPLHETRVETATKYAVAMSEVAKHEYWEWTTDHKDALMRQILAEERAHELVGCNHIQANLVRDAVCYKELGKVPSLSANDAYWVF